MLLCPLLSQAQEWLPDSIENIERVELSDVIEQPNDSVRPNFFQRTWNTFNHVLDEVDKRTKFDSTHIQPAHRGWTVKINGVGSVQYYRNHDWSNGDAQYNVRSSLRATLGAHISYRGLGFGFSINPGKLTGRNADAQFMLSSMGNAFGFELLYSQAKSFRGKIEYSDGTKDVFDVGDLSKRMVAANAYYSFNRRKFSSAAAFSQSQIQNKSCGSFLIGASYTYSLVDIVPNKSFGKYNQTESHQLGIGAGYAYNWVLPHKWLIHASCIPQIMVYNRLKSWAVGLDPVVAHMRFPDFAAWTRFSIVKNWSRHFFCLQGSFISNFMQNGDEKNNSIYLRFNGKLSYGIRF